MSKQSLRNWQNGHKHWAFWWSTAFGCGLLKPAPGTWGSLAGLAVGYFALEYTISWLIILTVTAVYFFISMKAIDIIEENSTIHDAPEIVSDEVVGQWIALLPCLFMPWQLYHLGLAFLLFRLFDIWKPWPIGPIDKNTHGGFGVMIDDVVAGVFAALILTAILQITL